MKQWIQCENRRQAVNAVLSWQFEGYTFYAHKIPGNKKGLYQVSELRTGRRAGRFHAKTAKAMKELWLTNFSEVAENPAWKLRFHNAIDAVEINVMDLPELPAEERK